VSKKFIHLGDEDWVDYELLSEAAALIVKDKRSVHLRSLMNLRSIMIITPAGGPTSMKELGEAIRYIADTLENVDNYV